MGDAVDTLRDISELKDDPRLREIIERFPDTSIGQGEFRYVEPKELRVDNYELFMKTNIGGYQRITTQKGVEKITKSPNFGKTNSPWHESACGALVGSLRDNGYIYLIDGGHRRQAAIDLGVPVVPVLYHRGMTVEEEAVMFLKHMVTTRLNAVDKWRSELTAKKPAYLDVNAYAEALGFTIPVIKGRDTPPFAIVAHDTLNYLIEQGGARGACWTLAWTKALWPNQPESVQGDLLRGLFMFLYRHGDQIKPARMINSFTRQVNRIGQWTALAVIDEAQDRRLRFKRKNSKSHYVYTTILDAYNARSNQATRLQEILSNSSLVRGPTRALTQEQVRAMRQEWKEALPGTLTYMELAKRYNSNQASVHDIVHGLIYRERPIDHPVWPENISLPQLSSEEYA